MKLAKLEALVENQRAYIEENFQAKVKLQQQQRQVEEQRQGQGLVQQQVQVKAAPSAEPAAASSIFMNFLGFENATSYIDLGSGMGLPGGAETGIVAPLSLDPNEQGERQSRDERLIIQTSNSISSLLLHAVFKDIKRARQHAEFLAGEHARKDGYLGGVGLEEEGCDEEVRPSKFRRTIQYYPVSNAINITPHSNSLLSSQADLSSMPLRTAPLPSPPPKHPFKCEPKTVAYTVSPNVGVDPEITRPSVRAGGMGDWSAPTV